MGNKSAQSQNYREKFIKFLHTPCDETELRARIIDISHNKVTEEEIISSLLPEDIRKCFEHDQEHITSLLHFLTDFLLLLSNKTSLLSEEGVDLILFLLKVLARIIPVLYEVLFNKNK